MVLPVPVQQQRIEWEAPIELAQAFLSNGDRVLFADVADASEEACITAYASGDYGAAMAHFEESRQTCRAELLTERIVADERILCDGTRYQYHDLGCSRYLPRGRFIDGDHHQHLYRAERARQSRHELYLQYDYQQRYLWSSVGNLLG